MRAERLACTQAWTRRHAARDGAGDVGRVPAGGSLGLLAVRGLASALADAPPAALVVGGIAFVVVAFVAREVASGALREVGKDLWEWVKRRTIQR